MLESISNPSSAVAQVIVPFELEHGFILVQATVDGFRGTFLLDTGSPQIYLSQLYLQPTRAGGIDTVRETETSDSVLHARIGNVTIHTVRLGTTLFHLASTGVGPPLPLPTNAAINLGIKLASVFQRPILGTLGLTLMASFETIIDYPHRRLLLIPLDSAGRRTVQVREFVPRTTVPLLAIRGWQDTTFSWWGVAGQLGAGLDDTLLVDTGNPNNSLGPGMRARLRDHLVPSDTPPELPMSGPLLVIDRVVVAECVFDTLTFNLDTDDPLGSDALGYGFLRTLGVVGFNLRTRHLLFYRVSSNSGSGVDTGLHTGRHDEFFGASASTAQRHDE